MFLNDKAQILIEELRNTDTFGAEPTKASICDAMSAIILMHQMHANTESEKRALMNALDVLTNYNNLITELSKEK